MVLEETQHSLFHLECQQPTGPTAPHSNAQRPDLEGPFPLV